MNRRLSFGRLSVIAIVLGYAYLAALEMSAGGTSFGLRTLLLPISQGFAGSSDYFSTEPGFGLAAIPGLLLYAAGIGFAFLAYLAEVGAVLAGTQLGAIMRAASARRARGERPSGSLRDRLRAAGAVLMERRERKDGEAGETAAAKPRRRRGSKAEQAAALLMIGPGTPVGIADPEADDASRWAKSLPDDDGFGGDL